MIYITQGHELSIGPEVFLKAYAMLPAFSRKHIQFIGSQKCLETHLEILKIPFKITQNNLSYLGINLSCNFIQGGTTESLLHALDIIKMGDILLTLPSTKEQIRLQGKPCKGHTDFFRQYFKSPDISMVFHANQDNVLLITDHLPLKKITLTTKNIFNKINLTLKSFPQYFYPFEEVLISGLNPHAGEDGLLGNEEQVIRQAIFLLKKSFKTIRFQGPLSGDALHFYGDYKKKQLKVYMFHDQGLGSFKEKHGLIGLNISLGLPFLRMSVDHGTAFDLYGKNKANCLGCYYLLIKALEVHHVGPDKNT